MSATHACPPLARSTHTFWGEAGQRQRVRWRTDGEGSQPGQECWPPLSAQDKKPAREPGRVTGRSLSPRLRVRVSSSSRSCQKARLREGRLPSALRDRLVCACSLRGSYGSHGRNELSLSCERFQVACKARCSVCSGGVVTYRRAGPLCAQLSVCTLLFVLFHRARGRA